MPPDKPETTSSRRVIAAVFKDRQDAQLAVERLIDRDFPMDSLSLLGKAEGSGDDPLGIYYANVGERMKAWGAHGAFWGGLWGLLASAAGMFVVPGLGTIFAVGPVVEAIAAALASAAVTGGAMAGAAALSQVAVAIHRLGIPHEHIAALHEAIVQGHYVVLLRCGNEDEAQRWQRELAWRHTESLAIYPYTP